MHLAHVRQQVLCFKDALQIDLLGIQLITIGVEPRRVLANLQGRLILAVQCQQNSGFLEGLANRGHIVGQSARGQFHEPTRFLIGQVCGDPVVVVCFILVVDGTAGEHPHAAGKHGVGMAFHHQHLEIRSIIDEHDRGCGSHGYGSRVEIFSHIREILLVVPLMYADWR